MAKSFYDLDWWIELNVKKDETLRAEYDKVLGRVSNIVIIYSAFSVFLLAIWKDAFKTKRFYQHFFQNINPWYFCFIVIFFGLLATSFFNTIRFLLPKDNPSLEPPKKY
jgi:hypothetical protein